MDASALLPGDLLRLGWACRVVERHYELRLPGAVVLPWSRSLSWTIHLARAWSGLPTIERHGRSYFRDRCDYG